MRKLWAVVFVVTAVSQFSSAAANPESLIAKVHTKGIPVGTERLGTAWCLNTSCEYMITNYHVLKFVGEHAWANGERVKQAWMATGPDDQGAQSVPSFTAIYKFNMVRDIAVLKMSKPMSSHGLRAVRLQFGKVDTAENITVMGYSNGKLTVVPGSIDGVMEDGLLRLQLQAPLKPGSSGGLVLNSENQAIGLLCGLERSYQVAYAVPMWSVADFLRKIDAHLYAQVVVSEPYRPQLGPIRVSRKLPEVLALLDYDPEPTAPKASQIFTAARGRLEPAAILPKAYLESNRSSASTFAPEGGAGLRTRAEEALEVRTLRQRAEQMVHDMSNFMAVQTITFSDSTVWQHQVRVANGEQLFIDSTGKQLTQLPMPRSNGNVPGSEWRNLPQMVGSNLRLPLRFVGKKTVLGTDINIFEYRATVEDEVCAIRVKSSWLRPTWKGFASCYGDVWTDDHFNIIRLTQRMVLPGNAGMRSYSTTVLYGWLSDNSLRTRLVPVSMRLVAEHANGQFIESSVAFSGYQVFQADSKIVYGGE